MRIGELARQTGVSPKTLRFYEDEGLLEPAARTPSGYRVYDAETVDRLRFIRDGQGAGLTLRQIRQVLEIRDGGQPPCQHVGELIEERLADVRRRIAELQATRRHLEHLARRTQSLDPADCHGYCQIIEPSG